MNKIELKYDGRSYVDFVQLDNVQVDGSPSARGFQVVFRLPVIVRGRPIEDHVVSCRVHGWLFFQNELLGMLYPVDRASLDTATTDNEHLQPFRLGLDICWERLQLLASSVAGSPIQFHLWINCCAKGKSGVQSMCGHSDITLNNNSWQNALQNSGFSRSLGPNHPLPRSDDEELSKGVSTLERAIDAMYSGDPDESMRKSRIAMDESGISTQKMDGLYQAKDQGKRRPKDFDIQEALRFIRSAAFCFGSIPSHHDITGAGQPEALLATRLVAVLIDYEAATR